MDERLRNLAEGCVEIHKTQGDTKEVRKHFRLNIQAAYDLGRDDAAKEGVKAAPVARTDAPPAAPSTEPPAPDTSVPAPTNTPADPTRATVTAMPGEAPQKPAPAGKGKAKDAPKSQAVSDAAAAAKKATEEF